MFSGRRSLLLAALATGIAVALVPAAASADPVVEVSAKKPAVKLLKGKVISDGSVTPGQQETVTVSKMPPRAKFRLQIEPPPTTPQCGQFYFCHSARVHPVPGTPGYRSSGKGTATVSFIFPSGYIIQSNPFRPATKQFVTWMTGQVIHINVVGQKRTKRARLFGFGFGRSIVQLPA